ncbi:hypothetical protein GALL_405840 [mine drainage metagenome]|uniref:Uncharacterized protein n=1 Tax=mine drainage metagenome TaxID=410659 RepID=A0A1J5Q1Z8_9ZZZZ
MRRVLVETVDVGAHQAGGVEVGQVLADVGFGAGEHVDDSFVGVDDVAFVVGDHDAG